MLRKCFSTLGQLQCQNTGLATRLNLLLINYLGQLESTCKLQEIELAQAYFFSLGLLLCFLGRDRQLVVLQFDGQIFLAQAGYYQLNSPGRIGFDDVDGRKLGVAGRLIDIAEQIGHQFVKC